MMLFSLQVQQRMPGIISPRPCFFQPQVCSANNLPPTSYKKIPVWNHLEDSGGSLKSPHDPSMEPPGHELVLEVGALCQARAASQPLPSPHHQWMLLALL